MDQVPIGLPSSILPSVSAVLSPECTSQFVRVQPNNLSSIVSSESAAFGNSTTVPSTIAFPSVPINFTIPNGSSPNVFIDNSKSTISFRVRYQISTVASTAYTGLIGQLQGSAYSWFNRCTEMVNGMVVDDRTGWDLANNSDLNWQYNVAERDSNALSLGLAAEDSGTDSRNVCQGHQIPIIGTTGTVGTGSTGSNYYSYTIPLKSALIGVDAKSMFPIGRSGKVDLTLYTPSLAPITVLSTAATGAGAKATITIDQIVVELFYLTLDQKSAALLPSPSKPWAMAGITSRVGSGTTPASASGAISVQVPLRVKSARSLSTRFSDSVNSTVGAVNGQFDSKCPLVSAMSYYLAGQKRVPNVPHNSQYALSNIFNHTLQAYYDGGADRLKSKCGVPFDTFAQYWATGTAPTDGNGFDKNTVAAGSTSKQVSQSAFEFAEDLRLASTTNFLNGTDLTSSNSYLELNVTNSSSAAQNLTFIAKADILFIVMPDGNVEARV
jgi:hypothetical protein